MAGELKYVLDTSKEGYLIQKCKQNDDRYVELTILSKGQPVDCTGYTTILKGKKPDGTWCVQTSNMHIFNNIISFVLSRNFTQVVGEVKFELQLLKDGIQLTTFTFKLQVMPSVIQDGDLKSSNSITAVQELDNKISNALNIKNILETDINNGNTTKMRSDLDGVMSGQINPNLVMNGGFEDGAKFTGWAFSEYRNTGKTTLGWNWNANNNDTSYIKGNYTPYMRALSIKDTDVGGVIGSTFIKVKPNTKYTLSYYRQTWRCRITHEHAFYNESANLGYVLGDTKTIVMDEANRLTKGIVGEINNENETVVNGTYWKKVVFNITTPANCTSIKLNFVLQYSYSDAFFFLDDVKLEEGEHATPYCERMQSIIDNNLETNNKTISGAINELDDKKANKPVAYNDPNNVYTWYRKYDDGTLIISGGTGTFTNVGGTIVDLSYPLPIIIPTGFEIRFYGSIYPMDASTDANLTSACPCIYQKGNNSIRVLVYGGLKARAGYSIGWFGIGRWK